MRILDAPSFTLHVSSVVGVFRPDFRCGIVPLSDKKEQWEKWKPPLGSVGFSQWFPSSDGVFVASKPTVFFPLQSRWDISVVLGFPRAIHIPTAKPRIRGSIHLAVSAWKS